MILQALVPGFAFCAAIADEYRDPGAAWYGIVDVVERIVVVVVSEANAGLGLVPSESSAITAVDPRTKTATAIATAEFLRVSLKRLRWLLPECFTEQL